MSMYRLNRLGTRMGKNAYMIANFMYSISRAHDGRVRRYVRAAARLRASAQPPALNLHTNGRSHSSETLNAKQHAKAKDNEEKNLGRGA